MFRNATLALAAVSAIAATALTCSSDPASARVTVVRPAVPTVRVAPAVPAVKATPVVRTTINVVRTVPASKNRVGTAVSLASTAAALKSNPKAAIAKWAVGRMVANSKSAYREKPGAARVVKVLTGISLKDARKDWRGGRNSFIRKPLGNVGKKLARLFRF